MFNKIFSWPTGASKTNRRTSPRANDSKLSCSYEKLEPRQLLAGIFYDAASSTVTISGDAADDFGRFSQVTGTEYRATLGGQVRNAQGLTINRSFDVGSVEKVVFIGFDGNDVFENFSDVTAQLLGGNGDDTLQGGSQDDVINGGAGNDNIEGDLGNDRIIGGGGFDRISGGDGDDQIFLGDDGGEVRGENGDDLIFGGAGRDIIFGGDGIDKIFGLAGNDFLSAGDGGVAGSQGTELADLILGHDGDDIITGFLGLNVFYGGNGNDILSGSSPETDNFFDVARGRDAENRFHGQGGNDRLTGGYGDDFLSGNLGNDNILGIDGDDFILPGQGTDIARGGLGNDFVRVEGGNDFIDGEFGTDFVDYRFDSSQYSISGIGANLTLNHAVDGSDRVNNFETVRLNGTATQLTTQQFTQTNSTTGFFDNSLGFRSVVFDADDFNGGSTTVRDVDVTISFAKSIDDSFVAENETITPRFARYDEIEFVLTSPSGTRYTLISNSGGTEQLNDRFSTFASSPQAGFQGTITFDEAAEPTLESNFGSDGRIIPTSGTFRAREVSTGNPDVETLSLDQYNGESAVGAWTLFIEDDRASGGLSFYDFSVSISTDRDLDF